MKKVLILSLLILFMMSFSSCGTYDEVYEETPTYVIYKDTPTYTLIVRNGRPYYYYHGRYYVHPPRYYYYHHERPHKPKPNCNGVPAPKPPRNSDVSRPSRPTNNGNKPHLSGNRNVRPRR